MTEARPGIKIMDDIDLQNKARELGPFEWRAKNGTLQKRATVDVYEKYSTDMSLPQFMTRLQELAASLEDVNIELDSENTYGESHTGTLKATGWREATPEEVREKEAEKEAARRQREFNDVRLLEALKARSPELFEEKS